MQADKYDRQLRLWGRNGQEMLSKAKVCALGCSPVLAEILKSLILPGIGEFLIVDDAVVSSASYGEHFFLTPDEAPIGVQKAQALANALQRLNPTVGARSINKHPQQFCEEEDALKDFSIILVSNPTKEFAFALDRKCRQYNIPLLLIRIRGMAATLRVSRMQHAIIESHTYKNLFAANLRQPWAELKAMTDSIDLCELDDQTHAHIPFIVLIILAIKNAGSSVTAESVKSELQKMRRDLSESEKNFDEAVNQLRPLIKPHTVPSNTLNILNRSRTEKNDKNELFLRQFWATAKAVAKFVESNDGILPNSGIIPDMTSDSVSYLTLQRIFRDKAAADAADVRNFLITDSTQTDEQITDEFIKTFCRHAQELQIVELSSLVDEFERRSCPVDKEDEEDLDFLSWYAAFEAGDEFEKLYGRAPGESSASASINEDIKRISELTNNVWKRLDCSVKNINNEIIQLFVSAGNTCIHSTSAYIGGVSAQEATKLLCRQYMPIDNTYIFNGYAGFGKVIQM